MDVSNNFKFSTPINSALMIAGTCLCLVSMYYTIGLLSSLGTSNHEKWLMTITAIGFEACKFAFVPLGFALYSYGSHTKGSSVLALGMALVIVSIVASLGFLAAKTDQGIEIAKIESDEYKAYQDRLNTINKNIAMLSSAAAIDASSQWRKARENAASKVSQISALEQERSQTIEAMSLIDATTHTETGALFTALGNGWNMSAERVKKACYIVVAALLELCSIAALSLAGIAAIKLHPPKTKHKIGNDTKITNTNAFKNQSLVYFHPTTSSKVATKNHFEIDSTPKALSNKNASQSNAAASMEAPNASTEAALSQNALKKHLNSKAPNNKSAPKEQVASEAKGLKPKTVSEASIHDLKKFAQERKRTEEELKVAKHEQSEALKQQLNVTEETQKLSNKVSQIKDEVLQHKKDLDKKTKKPTPSKIVFDESLYTLICQEVSSGKTKQSIRAIQSTYHIGFNKAQALHQKMINNGIIQKKKSVQI